MNQVLHIFKKDARHLWPQLLASLGFFIAFGWVSVKNALQTNGLTMFIGTILSLLVYMNGWILTVQAVHDESLVGENQFWLSRPYRWPNLLIAKVLFIAVFFCLPLLLTQVAILAGCGLNPLASLPALLLNMARLTTVMLIPVFALSVVTSSFPRFTLTVLAALLYLGLLIWGSSLLSSRLYLNVLPDPYSMPLILTIFVIVCLTAITLQYATRSTMRTRLTLVVLPVCIVALMLARPTAALARHLYPDIAQASQLPGSMVFDSDPSRQVPDLSNGRRRAAPNGIALPFNFSGVAADSIVRAQGVQVEISAANGLHWSSGWQQVFQIILPREKMPSNIYILVDPDFLRRLGSTPATVTVSLANAQLAAGQRSEAIAAGDDYRLPNGGVCAADTFTSALRCRYPVYTPQLAYMTGRWTSGPCPETPSATPTGPEGGVWLGGGNSYGVAFALSPVETGQLQFSNRPYGKGIGPSFICPGTPVSYTPYTVVRQFRTTQTISNLDLTRYSTGTVQMH